MIGNQLNWLEQQLVQPSQGTNSQSLLEKNQTRSPVMSANPTKYEQRGAVSQSPVRSSKVSRKGKTFTGQDYLRANKQRSAHTSGGSADTNGGVIPGATQIKIDPTVLATKAM